MKAREQFLYFESFNNNIIMVKISIESTELIGEKGTLILTSMVSVEFIVFSLFL